ncbi:zf-HC2 domain-containing protein [Lysinibacillus sp. NPDC096418]|uniref:zf-HC2 domain-containing protein n=1 Tax=Lysinibacillus sp. NPDC096418 TaxID=3364138 RepID=UPI00380D16AC
MSQECSIVEDLLALYLKRTLQNDTLHFIENHIASCERCQQLASAQPPPSQKRPMKRTLTFFHLVFIVLSFMFALNSSLLGNNFSFIVSYAIFGCLTYLFYKNIWIVFVISFIPVFVWAIIDNLYTPLYITHTSFADIGALLVGASFIAILHTIFALLGSAMAIILRNFFMLKSL